MSRAAVAAVGILALAGVGGAAWYLSRPEPPVLLPEPTVRDRERLSGGVHPLHTDRIEKTALALADTVEGQPYSWGGGRTDMGWPQGWPGVGGGTGWDCGGVSLAYSALMLRYRWGDPDRTARGIADICAPVELGKQRPGDLAAYRGRHITSVLTFPDRQGQSRVLSASGGGQSTNGDDPRAYVRVHDRADYRSDFLGFMRLPAVAVSDTQAVTCMAVHRLIAGDPVPNDPRLPTEQLAAELATRSPDAVAARQKRLRLRNRQRSIATPFHQLIPLIPLQPR